MTIAGQRLAKHVPERCAVNKNRHPLLDNGFRNIYFRDNALLSTLVSARFICVSVTTDMRITTEEYTYCWNECSVFGSREVIKGSQTSAWGYNRVTQFLEDINTGTWSSKLGESQIWDSKIRSWAPPDSDLRMTALANSNCKRQTRPLVRESAPYQQTRKCLTVIRMWS
jgi:hypothetical protein